MARIEYERNHPDGNTDLALPLDWFPGPKDNCTAGSFGRSDKCSSFITDLSTPFMTIGGKDYTS